MHSTSWNHNTRMKWNVNIGPQKLIRTYVHRFRYSQVTEHSHRESQERMHRYEDQQATLASHRRKVFCHYEWASQSLTAHRGFNRRIPPSPLNSLLPLANTEFLWKMLPDLAQNYVAFQIISTFPVCHRKKTVVQKFQMIRERFRTDAAPSTQHHSAEPPSIYNPTTSTPHLPTRSRKMKVEQNSTGLQGEPLLVPFQPLISRTLDQEHWPKCYMNPYTTTLRQQAVWGAPHLQEFCFYSHFNKSCSYTHSPSSLDFIFQIYKTRTQKENTGDELLGSASTLKGTASL